MLPILFKIGPVPIHSYGLMIAVGFMVSLYFMQRDAEKIGINRDTLANIAFWSLLIGIIGTRVLHIIMFPESYSWNDPVGWIALWRGGLVFQGAPIPVIIYCWFAFRKRKIDFWKVADAVTPYAPIAQAFGRIGCFLNGCCYGAITSLPWGVRFPRVPWDLSQSATGSPAYVDHCMRFSELSMSKDLWSYPVHPTQLYGVAGLLAMCLALLYLRKKWRPVDGWILPTYFIIYSVGRFFVEFLRGDHNPTILNLFTAQQMFSLLFAVAGVVVLLLLIWNKSRHSAKAAD